MRYILLSIRPQWTCKILNGEKTIEVRRGTTLYNAINRLIKEQGKAPCLIYCTKGKPYLLRSGNRFALLRENLRYTCIDKETAMNGKVVAMFEAGAERIIFGTTMSNDLGHFCDYTSSYELMKKSCLTKEGMGNYLKVENNGVCGTAIHIHNLEIFGLSKELKEFNKIVSEKKYKGLSWQKPKEELIFECVIPLTNAPQSWQFVEVDE